MGEKLEIAVLGTGIMGGAVARNLVRAGHGVRVWNRTPDKAEAIDGATAFHAPDVAARHADLVLTVLTDGPAVHDVMVDRGALAAMRPDAVWIQSSTVGADWIDRLLALARARGVQIVDAPLLGTKGPAEKGELVVLAGGDDAAVGRAAPVFDAIGRKVIRVGHAGQASRLKLVVNSWILGLLGALAESIALSERLGLDPRRFLEAIDGGPLGAGYAGIKGALMLDRSYPPSFPVRLAVKDAQLVLEAAAGSGLVPPTTNAVAGLLAEAIRQGHGDEDMAALVEPLRP